MATDRFSKFGCLLLAVLGAALLRPSVARAEDYDDVVRQGIQAYGNGDYDLALEFYDRALRLDPSQGWAHLERGLVYGERKDFRQANAEFTKALSLTLTDADRAVAYYDRGYYSAEQSILNHEQALADVRRALRLNPDYARANAFLAWVLATNPDDRVRDGKTAWAHAKKARELDPADTYSYRCLAAAYAECGDFEQAVHFQKEFLKAPNKGADLELDRLNLARYERRKPCRMFQNRGIAYQKQGSYARALADFESAVDFYPTEPAVYNECAWLLATCPDEDVRDGKKAVEYARKALDLNPTVPNYMGTLGAAFAERGDFEEAIQWTKKALAARKASDSGDEDTDRAQLRAFKDQKPYRMKRP
jgi:tetratricopeptide (TPR) repeat protein